MNASQPQNLGPLIEALAWYDENSRQARAERIAWASSLYANPGIIAGAVVPLHLMEEARVCFVNGQYMAVVLSATSVIEHLLVEALEAKSLKCNGSLAASVEAARAAKLFPEPLLTGIDQLRVLRNPLVHRGANVGDRSLSERYRKHQVHPTTLLEGDAQFALKVLYEFFNSLLRSA